MADDKTTKKAVGFFEKKEEQKIYDVIFYSFASELREEEKPE